MAAMNLAPQLAFKGNCKEAFEHYASLIGGKITVMNTFGGNEDHALPPGSKPGPADKIRFAEVQFGDSALRGNDVDGEDFQAMQGFNISLHLEDVAKARRIFDALADSGHVTTPLAKVDWAQLFGMVTDRFGVPWLILVPRR